MRIFSEYSNCKLEDMIRIVMGISLTISNVDQMYDEVKDQVEDLPIIYAPYCMSLMLER